MGRPTDWWVLDLAGDPAPGAPGPITTIARSWDEMAEDAEHAERQLRTLMSDDAVGRWIGEAGQTFREQTGELPGQLAQCASSYLMAAQALTRWADAVATHQGTADAALARGRDARAALERARAEAAVAAADLARAAVAPSEEVVREATERHRAATRAHELASGQVAAAQAAFDLERQLALDAAELHAADANDCARRIHEASDAGIEERSRWEKATHALAEAWEFLVSVARFVVTGLAVLALIFGGPLTWLFLAAAFVLLADGIARWLQGRASLWEALVGTLGLASPDRNPSDRVTIPSGPEAAAAWWAGLSPEQRARAILDHPELVGRTDGIPAWARDRANRAVLPAYRAQLEAELEAARAADEDTAGIEAKLAGLAAVEDTLALGDRQLLVLDPSGERLKAAIAIGDVDTADHVAVFTPGMTSTVDGSLAGYDEDMHALRLTAEYEAAHHGDAGTVATVTWLGYEAPQWSETGDPRDSVISRRSAEIGGADLASFVNGIDHSRPEPPHLTALGHSYGSTTTGLALQRPHGVDDAVFFGSPGIGSDSPADLGLSSGNAYLVEARLDPVADLGRFDGDPSRFADLDALSSAAARVDGRTLAESTGHSAYLAPGTTSHHNLAAVVAGVPDRLVREDAEAVPR